MAATALTILGMQQELFASGGDVIVGISLGGPCVMRLRPYRPGGKHFRRDVISLALAPRSAYRICGSARWEWQHGIVATKELRYSITLRTARVARA